MSEIVLIGRGRHIRSIARGEWEDQVRLAPERIGERLAFMSDDHHAVRNFVVRDLPRLGRPMPLDHISAALHLSRERTASVVDDLERNRFFLVRGDGKEVSWAFPVTVEPTGHHLVFSTGERLDAA